MGIRARVSDSSLIKKEEKIIRKMLTILGCI
jgi:hypothetical protein